MPDVGQYADVRMIQAGNGFGFAFEPLLANRTRFTMLKRPRIVVAKCVVMIAVAVLLAAPSMSQAQQPPISPDVYGQLKYRYIGPEGNRATFVAGVPGRPNIWYVGAPSGGISTRRAISISC
jgi:hypothetical protein